MRTPISKKTLKELRTEIGEEVGFVGLKPFSHNIIGMCLREIHKRFGMASANKAIKDFDLDSMGWELQR